MRKFKPGVEAIILIFSDRKGTGIYHFPWLDNWLPHLRRTILGPLGISVGNIVRMQFAKMNVGSGIKKHIDRGPWARGACPPCALHVSFRCTWSRKHVADGLCNFVDFHRFCARTVCTYPCS